MEADTDQRGLPDLLASGPGSWPAHLKSALVHFGLLCLGIVLMMLVPIRVHRGDRLIVAVVVVVVLGAGVLAWFVLRSRARAWGSGDLPDRASWLALWLLRRTGLSLIGLAFFLLWTTVYLALWLVHPREAFTGFGPAPRVSDFFYYAVATALTSPPEGIGAGSRGVRAATVIEMLMGLALVGAYLASFVRWKAPPPPA